MKKLYILVPVVLTLLFGGLYYQHRQTAKVAAAAAAQAAEKAAAEEAAKKAEAERQAREDADRRAAERLAEEKRKEDEKAAKWAAVGAQIETDTKTYRAQTEKNAVELKALESRLATLRSEVESARRANLDLALSVEAAQVRKRNAELEIQRLVEMLARKGSTTLGSVTLAP